MRNKRASTLKLGKYIKKKRRKTLFSILISFVLIILFLIIALLALRLPFFQIKSITVNGVVTIDEKDLEKSVNETLLGNYYYIIPRTNFLFYPKGEILNILISKYKKINSINSHVSGLSNLDIILVERIPEVLVCEGFIDDISDSDNQCFVADKHGYIFEKESDNPDLFKYYVNANTSSTTIGNNFTDIEKFYALQKFVEDVRSYGIIPIGIMIGEDGSYEMYIVNKDQSTGVVYFDDRVPFDMTSSNLAVFWNNFMGNTVDIKLMPNFEYINLRFGNNVFYLIRDNGGK